MAHGGQIITKQVDRIVDGEIVGGFQAFYVYAKRPGVTYPDIAIAEPRATEEEAAKDGAWFMKTLKEALASAYR